MKFLVDGQADRVAELQAAHPDLIAGQLLTPLTRYCNWGGVFAIDNGCFSPDWDASAFRALLRREEANLDRCLWVTAPDVVGSAYRTLEVFHLWYGELYAWPVAIVAQDGIDRVGIPWSCIVAMFIGGTDRFKESDEAGHVVRAAQIMGKQVHVGRVGGNRRYAKFAKLKCDTCDCSAMTMFGDAKIQEIVRGVEERKQPLFDDAA
jgi:hypothetical protein